MNSVVVLPSWGWLYIGPSTCRRVWSLSFPFGDDFTLDHQPVSDFSCPSTYKQLWSLSFPFRDDFTLDRSPIGDFGFPSICRQVWSLSFPFGDDFTLNRPPMDDFSRWSTLGRLWSLSFPFRDDFTLDRPPCGLMESPPRLGLGTILGHLGQSLTHMNPRTRLWVQNLGMAWECVRHPRLPGLWASLHYMLLGHI